MTKLISENEMKDLSTLTPTKDNYFTREQVQELLNKKAEYYNAALVELKSTYQAIEIQEEQHKEQIEKLKENNLNDTSDLQQKIKEYDEKIKEYNNNSQLLTQLTVEARSTINDAKEKARQIENDALEEAKSLELSTRKEAEKIRENAETQSHEMIENAKIRMKDYEKEVKEQADKEAQQILDNANAFKENQENELNDLRKQVIEANEQIIQEGSDKAKSLITQAQEKANTIIDEAQNKYNVIAHEINQTKKAGIVITKRMKELAEAFDDIKELESYKLIKDVSDKTQNKSSVKGHSSVPVHQHADIVKVPESDIKEEASEELKDESELLSNNDVRNVLNQSPEKIEIDALTDSQINSMPEAIRNSLKLKKELTENEK